MAVDCCTMIYKLRDAQKEQNNEDEARLLKDILSKKKKSSDDFTKWFTEKFKLATRLFGKVAHRNRERYKKIYVTIVKFF